MWILQAFSGTPRKKLDWSETKRKLREMHEPGNRKKADKTLNLSWILDFRFQGILLGKMLNVKEKKRERKRKRGRKETFKACSTATSRVNMTDHATHIVKV